MIVTDSFIYLYMVQFISKYEAPAIGKPGESMIMFGIFWKNVIDIRSKQADNRVEMRERYFAVQRGKKKPPLQSS